MCIPKCFAEGEHNQKLDLEVGMLHDTFGMIRLNVEGKGKVVLQQMTKGFGERALDTACPKSEKCWG